MRRHRETTSSADPDRPAAVMTPAADVPHPLLLPFSRRWHLLHAVALVILAATIFSLRPITDSDFWHHITFGRTLVETGKFPRLDTLGSTTADRPWVSSGWLPSVALYKAYINNPDAGPVGGIVRGVTLLLGLGLLIFGIRKTDSPALAALLTITALAASFPRLLPRPDLFSQLMLPLLLMLLATYDRRGISTDRSSLMRLALCPLLFLLWANLHMLFAVGLAVLGIYCGFKIIASDENRRTRIIWIAVLLASFAATFATPYGWRSYWFIIENARLNDTTSRINELKPLLTALGEPGAAASFWMLGLWSACAVYFAWVTGTWKHLRAWQWTALVFLVLLALMQRRQIGLAAPGVSVLLFSAVSAYSPVTTTGNRRSKSASRFVQPPFWHRWYSIFLPAGILFFSSLYLIKADVLPDPRVSKTLSPTRVNCQWFPCEAVEFLRKNPPPGRLFHDLYTGGYLAYHLGPETKVFMDGRLEVYNNGTYDDFFAPMEGRMDVPSLLVKYGVRSVLIDWRSAAEQPGSIAAILSKESWFLCWFSDHYALFVKPLGPDAWAYVEKHGYEYLNPLMPEAFIQAAQNPLTLPAARKEAERAARDNPGGHLAAKAMEVVGGK